MEEIRPKNVAIVPAAGLGRRMGGQKKTYLALAGLPVLTHTLRALEACAAITAIIVVTTPGDEEFCLREVIEPAGIRKVTAVLPGGKTRQDSVAIGLASVPAIAETASVVIVHDGARPLVTIDIIERTIAAAETKGAAIAAVRVKDSIKEVSEGVVTKTLARDTLYAVQTPQAFDRELLRRAHKRASEDGFIGTDEASLVERLGVEITVVEGSYENIKITTPEDLLVAESILKKRNEEGVSA
jgi:2-C-methyl-D-erythritol 4-phosphate cytidylyltransferase